MIPRSGEYPSRSPTILFVWSTQNWQRNNHEINSTQNEFIIHGNGCRESQQGEAYTL